MKKFTYLILAAILTISFSVVSCKDEKEKAEPANSKVETQENPKTTANLNPKHGEPRHRCDLPVGAPLNSASASNNQQNTQSPVRIKSATPKINPPHGQPGHDCSVPVGAKLNS